MTYEKVVYIPHVDTTPIVRTNIRRKIVIDVHKKLLL